MPFANNQGINIYYEVEGQGPPLIMLHGGLGSLRDFYDFGYVEFLKKYYQLILIDIRAMGNSDKPADPGQYSFKIFADDVIAVLDDLNIRQANCYGYSLGGWVVFSLAKYYPDRLISMVNADGVPSSNDHEGLKYFVEMTEEEMKKMGLSMGIPLNSSFIERALSNDKPAIYALIEWLRGDVNNMIEEIINAIDTVEIPCFFVQSSAIKDGTDEFALIQKAVQTIDNAKEAKFEELNHGTVLFKSEFVLPAIKDFLDTVNT